MTSKPLLIFDCDGTLVDSEGLANEIFVEEVNKLGASLSMDEAWAHFPGTSLRLCMEYVTEKYQITFPVDFIENQRIIQKEIFARDLALIPGIASSLENLSHFRKCVASNGPSEVVRSSLQTTKIFGHFEDAIYSAYDLGKWKPDPALFLHAAKSQGFTKEKCIVIEDSAAGINAGISAGMRVLAFRPPHHQYKVELPENVQVSYFSDMHELPEIIQAI